MKGRSLACIASDLRRRACVGPGACQVRRDSGSDMDDRQTAFTLAHRLGRLSVLARDVRLELVKSSGVSLSGRGTDRWAITGAAMCRAVEPVTEDGFGYHGAESMGGLRSDAAVFGERAQRGERPAGGVVATVEKPDSRRADESSRPRGGCPTRRSSGALAAAGRARNSSWTARQRRQPCRMATRDCLPCSAFSRAHVWQAPNLQRVAHRQR